MKKAIQTRQQLEIENAELRSRLEEAEETLSAIRNGEVDAFVVTKTKSVQTIPLYGTDYLYRAMVEYMNEGAVTLTPDGTIFYCNPYFAELIQTPSGKLIGSSFQILIKQDEQNAFITLLKTSSQTNAQVEFYLQKTTSTSIPVQLSLYKLETENLIAISMIVTDLSERKRTEQALQQRNRELTLLDHANKVITSSLDLDQILAHVLAELYQQMQVIGSFWLTDFRSGELVCRQASGPSGKIIQNRHLLPGQGISGWVAQHGESLIIPNATLDPRHFGEIAHLTGEVYLSILAVPLRSKKNVIGVLQVLDSQEGRFTMADLTIVESLAASAAIAIENSRLFESLQSELKIRQQTEQKLHELSITDELTGLNNRRGFLLLAEHHIKLMRRIDKTILLAYVDLDGLKQINDTLGHLEGDKALIQTAFILRKTFRESDILARLGGDEFAVLITINEYDHYQLIMDHWEKNILEFNTLQQYPFKLSMSIGILSLPSDNPFSLEEMLNQADKVMYEQKQKKKGY